MQRRQATYPGQSPYINLHTAVTLLIVVLLLIIGWIIYTYHTGITLSIPSPVSFPLEDEKRYIEGSIINHTNEQVSFGDQWDVEQKESNGTWSVVEPRFGQDSFLVLFHCEPGKSKKVKYTLLPYYEKGLLIPGREYRIVQEVQHGNHAITLYGFFTIKENP